MTKLLGRRIKNIVLIGMPGAGKTTFGKMYAIRTKRKFYDLDAVIERSQKTSVAAIISEQGLAFFRELEITSLQKLQRIQNAVIALGGGSCCSDKAYALADALGAVVYLKNSVDVLSVRLSTHPTPRPLLASCKNPEELKIELENILQEREPFYERADHIVRADLASMDNMFLDLSFYEKRTFYRDYQNDVYKTGKEESFYHRDQAYLRQLQKSGGEDPDKKVAQGPSAVEIGAAKTGSLQSERPHKIIQNHTGSSNSLNAPSSRESQLRPPFKGNKVFPQSQKPQANPQKDIKNSSISRNRDFPNKDVNPKEALFRDPNRGESQKKAMQFQRADNKSIDPREKLPQTKPSRQGTQEPVAKDRTERTEQTELIEKQKSRIMPLNQTPQTSLTPLHKFVETIPPPFNKVADHAETKPNFSNDQMATISNDDKVATHDVIRKRP